ncbi:ComF family protein [Luteimonas endophytica]|uniref:ComF family protein n=1 Tax=Luteimonas endophytica TaxID=3042023 RepID=UPI002F40986A
MAVNLNKGRQVDGWLARLGSALCPPRCPLCREPGRERDGLCPACAAGLPWNRHACVRCAVPLPQPGPAEAGTADPVGGGRDPADPLQPPAVPVSAGPAGGASQPLASPLPRPGPIRAGPEDGLRPVRPLNLRRPAPVRPGPLCGACLARPPPLAEAHAAFVYGFPLDRLLPRFKFHQDLAAGRLLAGWMADALAAAPRPDALLALPLHRARLRSRGYDQALELARPLARAFALPLLHGALRRQRATAPQSRLDAAARRRNLRGAFVVPPGAPLPAHVALVDDVMTTGATLHAAANALRRAGVARVDAWVCARVP